MGKAKKRKEIDPKQAERVAASAGADSDPDDEGDDYTAGVVSNANNLQPGDYEVVNSEGIITVVRGVMMTPEEIESMDDQVVAAASADERYEKHTANRKLRFNSILERGKAASELQHQSILDFTDDWKGMKKVSKNFVEMIECKHGNYIEIGRGIGGNPRVRQLSNKEMQKLAAIGSTDSKQHGGEKLVDDKPCGCKICEARRKNDAMVAPASGLRSGKKLGWDRYGPGRTL